MTDWRGAINTNRWLSLSSETSLLAAALEKYDPISALALPLRQTCDVCPGDSRAFWAGKSPFRAERNRETENGRLAGGEDWIRTRGCVSPDLAGKTTPELTGLATFALTSFGFSLRQTESEVET